MGGSLTSEELEIVNLLRQKGVSSGSSALAVAMIAREHSRPEAELLDIIRQYQHLETPVQARDALADLRQRSWIVEAPSYGLSLTQQAPDLKAKVAAILGDPAIEARLTALRAANDPYVRVVGQMNDEVVYTTFLDLIRGASSEICLPMLATSPKLGSVPLLQERADRGVLVRVLLGSPEVVTRMRGQTMRSMALDAIAGWRAAAEGHRNLQVKIAHDATDMQLASCMLVDGRILRFDVYDPARQRSLQGVMLEVTPPQGFDLNLCALFRNRFGLAWQRARPVGSLALIGWWIKREKRWTAAAVAMLVAFSVRNNDFGLAIAGSIAATQVGNALASSWKSIRDYIKNRR